MSEFAGRRVVVVGLGTSGYAAARALAARDAKVTVSEQGAAPAVRERADALRREGIEVITGGHDLDALDADLAVISPGVPPMASVARALASRDIETISEVELGYRIAPTRRYLAVTGTNGKTTTTALLAAMLQEGGAPAVAAGNIGFPLTDAVVSTGPETAVAVEVSSFQLAGIDRFRPGIAAILNIAEDHVDWHDGVTAYAAAKARITENQREEDVLVFNAEDERSAAIATRARARTVPFAAGHAPADGIGAEQGRLLWRSTPFVEVSDLPLIGRAGIEDVCAAAAAALCFGIEPAAAVRAIKGFRPLGHRLEIVARVGNITYIDDSKATNPHATLAAVQGLSDVVLIAGGRSKGIDLSPLARTVPPVRTVVTIGEAADEVRAVFDGLVPVEYARDMNDAVARATRSIRAGSVLLSPGCASLDMYESYAARGEAFVRAVRELLRDTR